MRQVYTLKVVVLMKKKRIMFTFLEKSLFCHRLWLWTRVLFKARPYMKNDGKLEGEEEKLSVLDEVEKLPFKKGAGRSCYVNMRRKQFQNLVVWGKK